MFKVCYGGTVKNRFAGNKRPHTLAKVISTQLEMGDTIRSRAEQILKNESQTS
jgi:hypothetical protein